MAKLSGLRNSIRRKSHYEKIQPQEQDPGRRMTQPSNPKPKTLKRNSVLPIVKPDNKEELPQKQISRLSTALLGLRHGNPEAIRQLEDNGFHIRKPEFNKSKALVWAAENGHEAAARFLVLEYGVNMDDFVRMDALYIAAKGGHTPIIDLFLEQRFVDPKRKYENFQTDALHEVVKYGSDATVQKLLHAGADVTARCKLGRTAFHEAAVTGNIPVLLLLLQYNTDLTAVDSNRETALHLTTRNGHIEAVRTLLDLGIGVTTQNMDNSTALHLAVQRGQEDIMTMLLERNADVMTIDVQGRTPLHWAMMNGNAYMTTLLLYNGANPHAKDRSGQTPLALAHERGFDEMFRGVR